MNGETQSGAMCPNHPETPGQFVCARCQTAVCVECCYTLPDASVCCKTCYHAESPPAATAAPAATIAPVKAAPSLRLASYQPVAHTQQPQRGFAPPTGQGCVQHPHVRAMSRCHNCGAGSCLTCDFLFPGNYHFCPVCVATGSGKLSPRRKKYMIAAFILAAWSSLGFALFFGGAAAGLADGEMGEMLLGILMILLAGVPAVVGTALGMSARRPGGPNPVSVWIALIWNSLLFAGLALLVIVGSFME